MDASGYRGAPGRSQRGLCESTARDAHGATSDRPVVIVDLSA